MTIPASAPLDPPDPVAAVARRRRLRPVTPVPWRRPLALAGLGVIGAWAVIAIFAPLIAPQNPLAQNFAILAPPSAAHWFGTDELGRDVFSRVLYGARITLPLAVILIIAALIIGAVIGGIAGYFGGWVDNVLMRVADLVFAFPGIILALAIAAALGPQLRNAVIAVVFVSWPSYARLVRSMVLSARSAQYVVASRLLGASGVRILFTDIRPNAAGPVLRSEEHTSELQSHVNLVCRLLLETKKKKKNEQNSRRRKKNTKLKF